MKSLQQYCKLLIQVLDSLCLGSTVLDDWLYVCGGVGVFEEWETMQEDTCLRFDLNNVGGSWEPATPLWSPLRNFPMVTYGSSMYIIGQDQH